MTVKDAIQYKIPDFVEVKLSPNGVFANRFGFLDRIVDLRIVNVFQAIRFDPHPMNC